MAYSETLAEDIRMRIGNHPGIAERQMFGGIVFMVDGKMAVGVTGEDLMVRVGKDAHDEAISRPGARAFDMSGRPMKGWVAVSPDGLAAESALDGWIQQGVSYAESLPPK